MIKTHTSTYSSIDVPLRLDFKPGTIVLVGIHTQMNKRLRVQTRTRAYTNKINVIENKPAPNGATSFAAYSAGSLRRASASLSSEDL